MNMPYKIAAILYTNTPPTSIPPFNLVQTGVGVSMSKC